MTLLNLDFSGRTQLILGALTALVFLAATVFISMRYNKRKKDN